MTASEQLERRAERGRPRGSAQVWAAALTDPPVSQSRTAEPWLFRLAVGMAAVVGGLALLVTTGLGSTDTSPAAQQNQEPLPAPILLDGVVLTEVAIPTNPAFDADRIFEPDRDPADDQAWFEAAASIEIEDPGIVVYAAEGTDPTGPVAVVMGDDTEPTVEWTLNTLAQNEPIRPTDVGVELADGRQLTEVWRYSNLPAELFQSVWVFDFGLQQTRLTVEPVEHSIWSVIARFEASAGATVTRRVVPGVDRPGYWLDFEPGSPVGVVFWTDEQFMYSLDSTALDQALDSLTVVDRTVWVDRVSQATRLGEDDGAVVALVLGLILLLLALPLLLPLGYRLATGRSRR